ncbi:3D-(3,5/4)-trihydroxycyclohexane-1,2-dione acylhydrolase (decyclizing) [Shouchella shacheensis]|uniref:3D-(3,5/4)-trihydroxycyclohexane-1,2-dione acylhydrolase (decyclizing) n=1 Tax=Shouchella shacheensis TaxID=1649580 RepID=UPI00073FD0F0|nr:3D-(3,5/4)-trihydroxycyclohexane-1,2-dione acylhydrolase (decyclizing) [Shouchella shacheensis]
MSQALLRFLDNQYVEVDGEEKKFIKGVMGIFGHGNVTGMGEALEQEASTLPYIQGKNEQGMVHAATAFAKQKNRQEIYACTSSIGPGALNMVPAAGTATVNRIPVLLLPGDIFATRQPDPVLQQVEDPRDYTMSASDAFKPVSKYWDRVSRPEQLMTAMINAMRVLTDPVETGAVTVSLPQDVQSEAYDYPEEFFEKRVHLIERRKPSDVSIEKAMNLIKRKKHPVIIAGGGVLYSEAIEELKAFAEAFTIPVGETQAGKSSLPWDYRLNMGSIGSTGSSASNHLAKEADLVIGVGTRLTDFSTSSKTAFQHPDVEFLNINVSNRDAMKLNGRLVVADAKEALRELTSALQAANYQSDHKDEDLYRLKEEWTQQVDAYYADKRPEGLSQTQVLGELNAFVEKNDTIICAAGSLPGDLHRLWRNENPKTYHLEYGFSCMGYEVAGALGIKLAQPDDEVYSLVGDGSYLMLHSELVTSIQERKKINIVLFDNHGFQCIHDLQRGQGSEGFGNEFRYRDDQSHRLSGNYLEIDFAANAASLGAKTYTVHTVEELKKALIEAKKETVSTLIDIKVLPGTSSVGVEDSWWHLGVAEVSNSEKVQNAYETRNTKLAGARKF